MNQSQSTNKFTEHMKKMFVVLKTIETLGPLDPNIGELGDRGVVLLDYLQRRMRRQHEGQDGGRGRC